MEEIYDQFNVRNFLTFRYVHENCVLIVEARSSGYTILETTEVVYYRKNHNSRDKAPLLY